MPEVALADVSMAALIVGIALQLIGLLIAVAGVKEQHKQLTDENLKWRTTLREPISEAWKWIQTTILRRHQVVEISASASGSLTTSGHAVIGAGRAELPEGASLQQQMTHLATRIDDLYIGLEAATSSLTSKIEQSEQRVDAKLAEQGSRLEAMRADSDRVKRAIGGRNGHALRRTALGLSITAAGVALAAFASVAGT